MISAIITLILSHPNLPKCLHANISFTIAFSSNKEGVRLECSFASIGLVMKVSVISTTKSLSLFLESHRKLFRNFLPRNFRDVSKDLSSSFRAFVYF